MTGNDFSGSSEEICPCDQSVARASATRLSVESLLLLGQIALNRNDFSQAFTMFETAARSGDAKALNMLGRAYERGWGTVRNPNQAALCFYESATAGDGWAMFNLADLYLSGQGIQKDTVLAYNYYIGAARKGIGKALNMLGLLHEDGSIGSPDLQTASIFFQAASDAGDHWGALNLGRIYLFTGDQTQACASFHHALQVGKAEALEALTKLLSNIDDHSSTKTISDVILARIRLYKPGRSS